MTRRPIDRARALTSKINELRTSGSIRKLKSSLTEIQDNLRTEAASRRRLIKSVLGLGLLFVTLPILGVWLWVVGPLPPEATAVAVSLSVAAGWMLALSAAVIVLINVARLNWKTTAVGLSVLTILLLASWRWVIRPQIDLTIQQTCGECRQGSRPVNIEFTFENLDLELDCGSPLRRVRVFQTLQPYRADHVAPPEHAGNSQFERDRENVTAADVAATLRRQATGDGDRRVVALLLIGSTDERKVTAVGRQQSGHADNPRLAAQRATAVKEELQALLAPAPPIIVLNRENLPIARLTIRNETRNPIERPTEREVFVCALWQRRLGMIERPTHTIP